MEVRTKQHISWWSVSWSAIPEDKVHGVLLGYRVRYQVGSQGGRAQGGDVPKYMIDVGPLTRYVKVKHLTIYTTYEVTVAAHTIAGEGPSEIKIAGNVALFCFLFSRTPLSFMCMRRLQLYSKQIATLHFKCDRLLYSEVFPIIVT